MKKQTWIKVGVLLAIIVGILVIDLVTKYVLDARLEYGESYSIIPRLFNFKIIYNIGAAWGIMAGKQVFLIVLSVLFLAIFIFYFIKEKNKTWLLTISFGFLIGGCVGNLYDRAMFGFVRDFIQFDFWQGFPVFNFADTFLTIGVVLFVIYLVIFFVKNRKHSPKIVVEKNDDESALDKSIEEKIQKIDEKARKNAKKIAKNMKKSENLQKEVKKVSKNLQDLESTDKADDGERRE